jgi:NADH-quinone oxidoreductase subunit M
VVVPTGEPSEEVTATVSEITKRELVAVVPVLVAIVALGIFPQVALDIINPVVGQLQHFVSVVDPTPAVGALTEGIGS